MVTVFFQTGTSPDLTAGERTGETTAWKKIAAKSSVTFPAARHMTFLMLVFGIQLLQSGGVGVDCGAAGDAGGRICGAVIHDSTFLLYA
jgi:hypothetical protein